MFVKELLPYKDDKYFRYQKSYSRVVFKEEQLYDYRRKGYRIRPEENYWRVTMPTKVYIKLLLGNGEEREFEIKSLILSYLEETTISEKRARTFVNDVIEGRALLEVNEKNEVIRVSSTQIAFF